MSARDARRAPAIRQAQVSDRPSIWQIMEPIIRAGETYALPCDMSAQTALAYWFAPGNQVFVATEGAKVCGSYYLRANQQGGGDHVANAAYMTAPDTTGRGIATAMCRHSIERARESGFLAIQFNFVVSTNHVAVGLWQKLGFAIVGRLPAAFRHPDEGLVDALVLFKSL